eukprot:CAMPEP_0178474902 /NCGR_PEP_ID=MMETSP0696-20121128/2838_1 /TAXON_ID=265572 /ORGANISM="Extubocellulus spinifer, Strain CCMP396" /LENGTH=605 /DNA_ID=CAMNT_0020102163 /DNA_START=191 /DNA_END=2008 /DNA_ORIENTATION=+
MHSGGNENDGIVLDMHHAPRFGHTSDLSKLASIHPEERRDYRTGAIAFGALVAFFFLLWFGHLLGLKARGKERVGCAAGQLYQEDTANLISDERAARRHGRIQFCFILCITGIFLSCAVLLGSAVPTAMDATAKLGELNMDVQAVVYEGIAISQSAMRANAQLKQVNISTLAQATTYCPMGDDAFDIAGTLEHSLDNISTAKDHLESYLDTVKEDGIDTELESLLNATMSFEQGLEWISDNDWSAKLYVLVLCVISTFFLFGLVLLKCNMANDGVQCFMAYILLPVFIMVILGGIVFAGAASSLTIVNADFCSGGDYPGSSEGTMQSVLEEMGHTKGDIIWDAFIFYKNECVGVENPFDFLEEDMDNVVAALASASAVESYVNEMGLDVVNSMCGADIRPLLKTTQKLTEALNTVRDGLRRSIDVTTCQSVRPLYRRVFWGPTCNESVRGLTNIFACLVAICIFGMTQITVRAALYSRDCPEYSEGAELETDEDSSEDAKPEEEEYREYMSRFYDDSGKWKDGEDKKKESRDENTGSNSLGLAAPTFETESCEEMESWDEDEEQQSDLYAIIGGSPGERAGDDELTPLTPPTKVAFSRPETAGSC